MDDSTARALADALRLPATGARLVNRSGATFGATARLDLDRLVLFAKRMPAARAEPLDCEADGLRRLAESKTLRVPSVRGMAEIGGDRWLVLEWLDLSSLSGAAARLLGERLAHHHRTAIADRHGLDRDNWIGGTPQVNTPTGDWTEFLFEHRIGALLVRLAQAGATFDEGTRDRLHDRWRQEFADYCPVPSLLHGDLWSGNAAMLGDGMPVVYDPAVHYGDRECDLAMAALFGGFGRTFFDAYRAAWPLDPGWERRRGYYQLYHMLNHALLFGGGYLADARRRIDALSRGPGRSRL